MVLENEQVVGERVSLRPTKFGKIVKILKSIFNSIVAPYIVVVLMTAGILVLNGHPFAYVMLGIATIFNIPLGIPLIATVVSYMLFNVPAVMYTTYLLTYFIYLISTILITVEGVSKKHTTLIRLLTSYFISSICVLLFTGFSAIGILQLIINILVILAFYPVFTSGSSMLFNIRKNLIFSKEEIISFGVMLAVILTLFSRISLLGFSVSNVMLVVLIITIAWKNDWVVGTSCGVILGLVYSIITGETTLIITTCGFTGLISGILSRYGKIPVVLTFAAGNIALSYLYTNNLELWVKLAEIIVASGVIVVLPKRAILKLEKIFNTSNALPLGYENQLGPASEMKSRIGAMSDVFDNLAHITTPVSEETMQETYEVVKKYLLDHKKNECISCKNKYECLQDEELEMVANHLATRLEENKIITREMIPVKCKLANEMLNDIIEMYNNIKLMRIIRTKENEMNTKLAEEYKVVSKLLKKISKQELPKLDDVTNEKQKRIREELKFLGYVVYEDTFYQDDRDASYEFITDILVDIEKAKKDITRIVSNSIGVKMSIKMILNSSKTEKSRVKLVPSSKYMVNAVVKQVKKIDSAQNGDSYIVTEFKDNNKIIAISDGMGSGEKSKELSLSVINMLEGLSNTGINKNDIINITNRILKTRENGTMAATLDMCLLNEKKDKLEFVKLGAPPSFIISDGIVEQIEITSDSMGIMEEVASIELEHKLKRNMYIVMMSDGVIGDITDKLLQGLIDEMQENINETLLMDKIMENIINSQNKLILDDITIIVAKIS